MARIKFEDGTVVNFEGTPTPQDIEEIVNKIKVRKQVLPVQQKQPGGIGEVLKGVGKGALSTLSETSSLGENVIKGIGRTITPKTLEGVLGFEKGQTGAEQLQSKAETGLGYEPGTLTKPSNTAQKVGFYGEKVAEFVNPLGLQKTALSIKKPLTLAAEKLYQSAFKPKNAPGALDIVRTGLKERVWLTKGGVEAVANKIDDFESKLGDVIESAKGQGVQISTKGMKDYLGEAKKFFENQVDVKEAKRAIKEIDDLGKEFTKKYGKEIPIEEAQKIKVASGQMLRKYYDRMSSAGIEGQKQATRFLKEKIVEAAPRSGDINERLSSLYKFDQALSKASGRIGNLNLLGFGTKFGAAAAGNKGAAIGLLADLLDKAAVKSGAAIGLNELAKIGQKGAVPLNVLLGVIRAKIEEESD